MAEQHAYFRNCIDTHLENRLHRKIQENTPMFRGADETTEASCEDFIEMEFAAAYPILVRQFHFFKSA